MSRSWAGMIGMSVLLCGCGDSQPVANGTGTSTGEPTPGTSTGTQVGSTSSSSTGALDPSSTGPDGPPEHVPPGFLNPVDGGPWNTWQCSMWLEDCPAGEKCAPYANDGGSAWNATRCVPVAPDAGQPGDPCTAEGPSPSGVDSCELHSMCWDLDRETGEGTCRAFCIGSESFPACAEAAHSCFISADGTTPLCLPDCDPLAQDCQDGFGCYPVDNAYTCAPYASGPNGGEQGSECSFVNACAPGFACVSASLCDSPGSCCSAYCSLSAPDCPEGAPCTSLYEDSAPPLGAEDVGVCGVAS